ncbi:AMP-binding protein [Zooshikella sp. RANM57]|uniref:AMP-binding protein n=1 Tax=Zooshikella sp. RANM57 TaxID=3425863 RepID=UPI003D6FD9AB
MKVELPKDISEVLSSICQRSEPVFVSLYGEEIRWQALLHAINHLQQEIYQSSAQRYAIYCEDIVLFTIALLAVTLAKKEAVLLPNGQPAFLASIAHDIDILLTDKDKVPSIIPVKKIPSITPYATLDIITPVAEIVTAEYSNLNVHFYTSGSTGQPKQITKEWVNLIDEVSALHQRWSRQINDGYFIGSVSFQHIYGLLFRVLWPLLCGRPIIRETVNYPENVLAAVEKFSSLVWVSSPALLKRFDLDRYDSKLHGVKTIFSSGGVLSLTSARHIQQCFGSLPIEIYGSTETGGIAYRQQVCKDTPWQSFPTVNWQMTKEGRLSINSLYMSYEGWFDTDDQIYPVTENTFHLLGRLDRIVKIEEKRVSLVDVEICLEKHSFIEDVVALAVDDYRQYLVCIVVLTALGEAFLKEQGKFALNQVFRKFLEGYFEAIVLPKKWQYVEELPLNSEGKLVQAELKKWIQ